MKCPDISNSIAVIIIAIAALSAVQPAPLDAGEISVTYRFDGPTVADAGRGFSRIEFPATIQSGRPGEPSYPFRGAAILLPPGEAVSNVRIERRGWRQLGGSYRLHPMQLSVRSQEGEHRTRSFLQREEAYLCDQWVHPLDSPSTTQYYRGHAIAVGCFSPVGYHLHRLLPLPDSTGVIELNISAHNYYTYRDTIAIEGVAGSDGPPPAITLAQNAPNPFNPSTVIRFSLDRDGTVDMRVYDVAGREVDRLVRRRMEAGVHAVTWRPERLPRGLYLYVLRTSGISLSKKAVLLR